MPLPRHVLQSVEYANVTSMRVSDDRFDRDHWDAFLYTSRLASAVGAWPWADVFMSTERDNLVLATLSGGIVGIGDALGSTDVANLHRVTRADGVLIKPDAALVPTDATLLADAQSNASDAAPGPMVASTWTDHAGVRALYVFAYARRAAAGLQTATIVPAALGLGGLSYVYDVYADSGTLLGPGQAFSPSVGSDHGAYFVVVPVGPSGIALVGDAGAFVSLGRTRISQLADDGVLHVGVELAAAEQGVVLHGDAPAPPLATASGGSVASLAYDPASQRFRLQVRVDMSPAHVDLQLRPP
jgi:hypothetical protein